MLHFCNVDFEDKHYAAGPAPDFDKSQWTDVKFTLGMEFPNLPYLIDEDFKISESSAICKYIAAKWRPELLGANPHQQGHAEMLLQYVMKLKETSTMGAYMGKTREEVYTNCADQITAIVGWLGEKTWLTGDSVTWLDFFFFELLDYINSFSEGHVTQIYPTLASYHYRFTTMPGFAETWADDNKTMKWPFNGDQAGFGGRNSSL
jgi:glutathione S-transferase